MRLHRVNPRRARDKRLPADPGNPHFIVVRGLDRYGRVNIADPGFGNRTMSVAGFESVWQGGIGCDPVRLKKKRPQEARPEAVKMVRKPLHLLLRALLGRLVPRAASLIATSLVGCFRHVSGKSRACEGKSYGHSDCRDKSFHDVSPLR
jgi:hypothetical protein